MQDAGSFQISKPVASRPSRSFRFFPNLSAMSSSLAPNGSAAKAVVALMDDDASETKETLRTNTVLLKPTAKPVSASLLLSNLGRQNYHSSVQHEELDARNQQQLTKQLDRPSSCVDGYNWRKYGQKKVKGSEYPRSYYKCTHPSCSVKKIVERSFDGQIAEIVYKGEHDHPKPRPPKRRLSSGSQEQAFVVAGADENSRETRPSSGSLLEVTKDPNVLNYFKRRKNEDQISGTNSINGEDSIDPRSVIQTSINECNTSGDGYHWRKYGQKKKMKDNSYPRSYYKCMSPKCKVLKNTEKAFDDSNYIATTYEEEHDHEMLVEKINLDE